LDFQEGILHDFNMGYYDRSQLNPHSSVAFIKKENEFVHPWSINAIGKYYGRAKLKDVIPLHDYLNLPAFLVDDLVLAISEGEAQRSKADADATPPEAGLSKEEKEILELARKAGMGKL
jgi:hypothetical protein